MRSTAADSRATRPARSPGSAPSRSPTLTHTTKVEDLSWQCWHCHSLKTRHDLKFAGPIGDRWLVDRETGQPWRGPTGTGPPDDRRVHRRDEVGADPPHAPPEQGDLFTLAD